MVETDKLIGSRYTLDLTVSPHLAQLVMSCRHCKSSRASGYQLDRGFSTSANEDNFWQWDESIGDGIRYVFSYRL